MRIALIHLSDMHISAKTDAILSRSRHIASAFNGLLDSDTQCVLVFTGDIANSGSSSEYALAEDLISNLKSQISAPLTVAVLPGNHDCNHRGNPTVRNMIIKSVAADAALQVDTTAIDACTAVQNEFLAFRDRVSSEFLEMPDDRLHYQYRVGAGTECELLIRCFNTAWMSQIKEQQGSLLFPIKNLTTHDFGRLTIAAFHHPYQWQTSSSLREFRRYIEEHSHLVLTGHEHEFDQLTAIRPKEQLSTAYVEASALYEHNQPNESAFNVLLLDTAAAKYETHHFEWKRGQYHAASEPTSAPLDLRRLDQGRSLSITPTFQKWLDDLGIPTERDDQRAFSDIFVYPELIEPLRAHSLSALRERVKSEQVYQVLNSSPVTYICGPARSGRTALAKGVYIDLFKNHICPVYLNARDTGFNSGDPPVALRRAVEMQYGTDAWQPYMQLPAERRVVILDDVDLTALRSETIIQTIKGFRRLADRVVVIGDNTTGAMNELLALNDTDTVYDILPFNHGMRDRFARRWIVSRGRDVDERTQSYHLHEIISTLDVVIGRNYVPAFPIYLISVFRAAEQGSQIDAQARTHGHYYDVLIRATLASGASGRAYDIRVEFLKHLAFEMFESHRQVMLESELRGCFYRYQDKHQIGDLDYADLKHALIYCDMLSENGDGFAFRYPYLYYYFVAGYLSSNIHVPSIRAHIRTLTETLTHEHAGDILLFLAYLSKDPFIIDAMITAADSLYMGTVPATLDNTDGVPDIPIVYEERKPAEVRQEWADARDNEESVDSGNYEDRDGLRARANAALHTIRILGQILKNFPGSVDAVTKLRVTNASYALSRRILAIILGAVSEKSEPVLREAMLALKAAYPGLSKTEAKAKAVEALRAAQIIAVFGITKVVSNALAAPELRPIYDQALPSDADSSIALIDASLRIDTSRAFPDTLIDRLAKRFKKKGLQMAVLRYLALERFAQIDVTAKKRQQICSLLGITFRAQITGGRPHGANKSD